MKQLSLVAIFILLLVLSAGHVGAATYRLDVLEEGNPGGWTTSLKTFDETFLVDPDQSITIDIWMTDAPGNATAGGAWIDFSGSTGTISYVSASKATTAVGGPWDPLAGVVVNEPTDPDGQTLPGVILIIVANLGSVAPDGDGDIIVGTVTLQCDVSGDTPITVETIPSTATWGPVPWDDDSIPAATLTIAKRSSSESTTTSVSTETTSTSTTGTPDTTTSTSSRPAFPPLCLVEKLYGKHSFETETLRYMRDSVLKKTPEGKEIIALYYEWSPEAVRVLTEDEELKEQLRQIISHIVRMIQEEKQY